MKKQTYFMLYRSILLFGCNSDLTSEEVHELNQIEATEEKQLIQLSDIEIPGERSNGNSVPVKPQLAKE